MTTKRTEAASKARHLFESGPNSDLCAIAGCGLPPWADIHIRESRTAAASKARHLNALRRKAPAMVEALRELGYTVIEPGSLPEYREVRETCTACDGRGFVSGTHYHCASCNGTGKTRRVERES